MNRYQLASLWLLAVIILVIVSTTPPVAYYQGSIVFLPESNSRLAPVPDWRTIASHGLVAIAFWTALFCTLKRLR